jgi:anti-sigma B factor antagonist
MSAHRGSHWLQRQDAGSISIVRVVPTRLMGEQTCDEVFGLLYGLVDEAGRNQIVLDLARVESLDSRGAGGLVMLNRKAQAAGGRLVLCGLRPEIAALFERMHLYDVLEIRADEEVAVGSFPSASMEEGAQGG